jgi:hypothetical protein
MLNNFSEMVNFAITNSTCIKLSIVYLSMWAASCVILYYVGGFSKKV